MKTEEIAEILEAVSSLKVEIAILKTKQESMESYIYKDLKPAISKLYKRIDILIASTFTLSASILIAVATMI